MPKERSINPAQAARKAEKAKALKKSKTEKHTRQNEKLARRNPDRLQRQIDELKELETSSGGKGLRPKDKQTLEQLEKDVKAVKRARDALGERAPEFKQSRALRGDDERGGGGGAGLGKRRRDERDSYGRGNGRAQREPESETDDEVRDIPMPRDTPPPIPRRDHRRGNHDSNAPPLSSATQEIDTSLPARPVAPAQTVYSSAPVLRDLAQESRRFVPAAVAQNIARKKGEGGRLLEPEELDRLESAGYGDAKAVVDEAVKEASFNMMNAEAEAGDDFDIDAEARRFERELKHVEMEEVPDEDL